MEELCLEEGMKSDYVGLQELVPSTNCNERSQDGAMTPGKRFLYLATSEQNHQVLTTTQLTYAYTERFQKFFDSNILQEWGVFLISGPSKGLV